MRGRHKHRRSTIVVVEPRSGTSTSTNFNEVSTSGILPSSHKNSSSFNTTRAFGNITVAQGASLTNTPITSDTTLSAVPTPSSSSTVSTPTFSPSSSDSVSVTPQSPSTTIPSTSVATSTFVTTATIFQSPNTTAVVTSHIPELSESATPSPSSIPQPQPLTLGSRSGIIILTLSILAGILSLLCAFTLWRRCRRTHEPLENQVHPVSFHQSESPATRRMTRGYTDSLYRIADVSQETASPVEIKFRLLREHANPIHRFSHDSDSVPSPPMTPTQNQSRFSPVPDIFDSRWPGRLLPSMPSQQGSARTLDGSQVVDISGAISYQSDQSDVGTETQFEGITTSPPNLSPSGPDTGDPVAADVTQMKGGLENGSRKREAGQAGGGTWDGPPPEESEKSESAKTGPPAYSPGDSQNIPPVPGLAVPLRFPPGRTRPLPIPSNGIVNGSSSSGKRVPFRKEVH